jgi:hypothetical protein
MLEDVVENPRLMTIIKFCLPSARVVALVSK